MTLRDMSTDSVEKLCRSAIIAVGRTGVMRGHNDYDRASRVIREELKEFILGDRYKDERSLVMETPNGEHLAWASLIATIVSRIIAERRAGS
jgi:hypothetical protein